MKIYHIITAVLVSVILLLAPRAEALMDPQTEAVPKLAFGYLANLSKDGNYDYLETIFPNSLAGSIQNAFNVTVMKPNQINKKMDEYNLKLEKDYKPYELIGLTDKLSADYFIYGNFIILPREKIKININLYCHGVNTIFTFSNTGKMEAEIFKLVDRIVYILIDFISNENFFISGMMPKGSKIGIITNLDGADLNDLYCLFLANGYQIASIQANSLSYDLPANIIGCFKFISSSENSYEMISDPRKMKFLHGTWTGQRYYEKINYIKKIYRSYDLEYLDAKTGIIDELTAHHQLDKILVIGFNSGRSSAWVRCIDIRTKDLVWMQSSISGSLNEICMKMINKMSAGINKKPD
jgi:hypothetical protein